MEKPEIKYPCKWSFRIIGPDRELMREAVKGYMGNSEYTLSDSNVSRSGKYVSLNLETNVHDEKNRNLIYTDLKKFPSIKMIM